MKKETPYKTEAEVCADFAATFEEAGCQVYPELCGWDMVVVQGTLQMGVEAKLKGSPSVVMRAFVEAIDRCQYRDRAPHFVAVVVGEEVSPYCRRVARELGMALYRPPFMILDWMRKEGCALPTWLPQRGLGLVLPKFRLHGNGGEPSPRCLSHWRIRALVFVAKLQAQGHLTGIDLRDDRNMRTLWLDRGWLQRDGGFFDTETGKYWARYVEGPRFEKEGPHVGYERELQDVASRNVHND